VSLGNDMRDTCHPA